MKANAAIHRNALILKDLGHLMITEETTTIGRIIAEIGIVQGIV